MTLLSRSVGALLLALAMTSASIAQDVKVIIPENTFVVVHLADPMSSHDVHTGDVFQFVVAKDVTIDSFTVIKAGSKGVGHVTEAHSAGSHGKSGGMRLAFDTVYGVDGASIPVAHNKEAEEQDRSTLGATALGILLTGGLGLFFHNFVHGSDITIPNDSLTNVLTIAPRPVTVDSVKDKAVNSGVAPIPTPSPSASP